MGWLTIVSSMPSSSYPIANLPVRHALSDGGNVPYDLVTWHNGAIINRSQLIVPS